MMLFFVGIIEMFIAASWTKAVAKTKVLASGAITMVNVLIWYYVLQEIIHNVDKPSIALVYAAGCSVGTIINTYFFYLNEKSKKFSKKEVKI